MSLVSPFLSIHFASRELATHAWEGVIRKVAHVLGPLLTPPPLASSEEERHRRFEGVQATKRALIAMCRDEAARHVVQVTLSLTPTLTPTPTPTPTLSLTLTR